jgi:hypothetical protein
MSSVDAAGAAVGAGVAAAAGLVAGAALVAGAGVAVAAAAGLDTATAAVQLPFVGGLPVAVQVMTPFEQD